MTRPTEVRMMSSKDSEYSTLPKSPSMGHTILLLHNAFPIAPSHRTIITHLHPRHILPGDAVVRL
ncbi:hypothetical protein M422DRAFT_28645 [Sphaerobolus stellatus SS14]|uniref:Uncharacterized protein n=1 Tax=Sphaerobolus stellatus (strain SS14) TaxID=990650 RepID=A0A0C9W5U2_SPHS4|nr:hypothetical protein M422DRAFT_28645 [Sphaerobolus stellatus SS14]